MSLLRPDLHIHTNASDGHFPLSAILTMAVEKELNRIAITDHDTLDALYGLSMASVPAGVVVQPGVEISAGGEQEVHVLGYGKLSNLKQLEPFFRTMREERFQRLESMVEKAQGLGLEMTVDDVMAKGEHSPGRSHMARAMVDSGIVHSVHEAFDKYLSPGCPVYVPRRKVPVTQVISLLRENNILPVLAHPGLLHMESQRLLPLLQAWKEAGLMGIEVYHPAHIGAMTKTYAHMAAAQQLLATGGSDFHGPDGGRHMELGGMLDYWPSADGDCRRLFEGIESLG